LGTLFPKATAGPSTTVKAQGRKWQNHLWVLYPWEGGCSHSSPSRYSGTSTPSFPAFPLLSTATLTSP